MTPGAVFRFGLDGEHKGLGQVLAIDGDAIAVALADGVWACAPDAESWRDAGRAVDHLVLRRHRLNGVEWVGEAPLEAEATAAHARWLAGDRAVVDAPPAALLTVLLDA